MTVEEFTAEMVKLESMKAGTRAIDAEQLELRDIRRASIFELVERFPIEVFREARKRLCEPGGSENSPFLPATEEIIEVCEEIVDENKRESSKPQVRRSKFKPVEHGCSQEKPQPSAAFDQLRAIARYEAEHILCPGKIPATCPRCGTLHVCVGVFEPLMKSCPAETANWNPHFKGLILCDKCSEETRD